MACFDKSSQSKENHMAPRKTISTAKAPAAAGPYSQAVSAGGFLFISGQLGIVPDTKNLVSGSAEDQTRQAMINIGAILEQAGLGYADIVKTVIMVTDINDFAAINQIYASFFTGNYPARVFFQAAALPLKARVEIEATAAYGA